MRDQPSALIIGGGIIGCSIAFELAKHGIRTTILDKGALYEEASLAAAGMLGAHVETHHPGPFFDLCKASLEIYRGWADELRDIGGISIQYVDHGIIRAALTEEDELELKNRIPWIGCGSWLDTAELRKLEPAMGSGVRGGLFFADDHQIHPVYTAKALRAALVKLGCAIKEWTPVHGVVTRGGRAVGVRTAEGELFADHIILAAGTWSSFLLAPFETGLPVFPVKGQCFSVRPEYPLIQKTIFTKGCYVVPKMDGTLLIGATQEEKGFDKKTTTSALAKLHEVAVKLLPRLEEAEFVSTWAGLRPGTPDGLPYIGFTDKAPGLIFATGHFRNGILLAPITGKIVSRLIMNKPLMIDISPYSPDRVMQRR